MVTINLRRLIAGALLALGGLTAGVMMGAELMFWVEEGGNVPFVLSGPTWLYYASGLGMWAAAVVLLRREAR